VREPLVWTEDERGTLEASGFEAVRRYRIYTPSNPEEWLVGLYSGSATSVTARGWGRTVDEVKQIAEEWEEAFYRCGMPQVRELWKDDDLEVDR
jgi:hypothetical protein